MKRLIHLMVLALVISISAGRVAASSPSGEGIAILGGSGNTGNARAQAEFIIAVTIAMW